MVGVPGKYKGCETCRARRVKCDNQRPYCKKCIDNGRQCAGYERETVFIIGTIQDEGRCSSHPPRVVKSTARRGGKMSKKKEEEEEKLAPVPIEPLQPAWDDLICLSNAGKNYRVQIAALQTTLQAVVRGKDETGSSKFTFASFPPYEPFNPQPFLRDDDFDLRAQCLVHLDEDGASDGMETDEMDTTSTDSICLFLYEHNNSVTFSNQAPWRDPSVQANPIRQSGPANFRTFPNHHFFARVYRPNAICAALLNRKSSFLSSPEWLTTPWELHPKSPFDHLLDILTTLPSLLSRADRIFPHDPTLQRRLLAQDLLTNCLSLSRQLAAWHATTPTSIYWISDPSSPSPSPSSAVVAQIPFADTFAYPTPLSALSQIYHWTAHLLLTPTIARLHETIFARVTDVFPPPDPALPPHLHTQLDHCPLKSRELAGNVCRSLDFALGTTAQPDVLVVPLWVVQEFYAEVSERDGDGQLEVMWCEGFRARLRGRGADVAGVVAGRGWRDLGGW
ncbi:hypothetical protein CONLIGDRAFT_568954 [Coniochaeta ligniaria NRRL 30616]|uniref:Zn(2)-C6 fungal-type domain-containing protein n=1 Tax=Coniochaeta ligniaria NRRL 30616 TaxID=1408157 RepID=A0A1J7J1X7_9PEZI|nr:hypothetical protein CONLIGDRAFT_568954 [Coniochaeta ligniaria NRRL 30616]